MKIIEHDLGNVHSLTGNVLVVDDWLCEGRAMKYVLNLLPDGANVMTLVMYDRHGSAFTPNFVGMYLDEDQREILFPYDPTPRFWCLRGTRRKRDDRRASPSQKRKQQSAML